ncbi:LamG domain-containing protein [Candidatus Babeliales bacterium]|nr:LamG domain-containing protein [Candidatus Babeliales bacterium]
MSLVAHWKLDEVSGTSIADSAGSNTGTWAGTGSQALTPRSSKTSTGLLFDGVGDKVTVPAAPSIDANGKTALTIVAWINPASDGEGTFGRIVDKVNVDVTAGYRFYLQSQSDSLIKLAFDVQQATTDMTALSNATIIPINGWSQVVCTYNEDGDGKGKLYYNGTIVTLGIDTAGVGTIADDSTVILNIGNNLATNRTFDSIIDDVRIYDHALTAREIRELYNNDKDARVLRSRYVPGGDIRKSYER